MRDTAFTPVEFLAWLSSLPPRARDAAVEAQLGIDASATNHIPPGDHLVGYHASGVAPIVRALIEVPVGADDVVIDVGSGLGKVVLLASLITGATARGIEIQATLVDRARTAAERLAIDVRFSREDAREANLDDGTVFFFYAPFTGPALTAVLDRLQTVAKARAIVVCALGIDLDRGTARNWLVARPIESFWLTIYDSVTPGVPVRVAPARSSVAGVAEIIAFERALS